MSDKEICKWEYSVYNPPGWHEVDGDDAIYCVTGCNKNIVLWDEDDKNCLYCNKEVELKR